MAVFGWLVLFCIAVYCWYATYGIFRVSMGFVGKLSGEFFFFFALSLILSGLSWWTFPFEVGLK